MAENKFFETMKNMGYKFVKQEELTLTYVKEQRDSDLYMVINTRKKYINAICVPKQLILYEKDLSVLLDEFKELREDAQYIADRAGYKLTGESYGDRK